MIRVLCMVKVRNRDMIYFIFVHLSVFLVTSCLLYSVLTEGSSPLFPCGNFTVAHYFTCSFYVNGLIDLFFLSCVNLYLVLKQYFHMGERHFFIFWFSLLKSHIDACTDLKWRLMLYHPFSDASLNLDSKTTSKDILVLGGKGKKIYEFVPKLSGNLWIKTCKPKIK